VVFPVPRGPKRKKLLPGMDYILESMVPFFHKFRNRTTQNLDKLGHAPTVGLFL